MWVIHDILTNSRGPLLTEACAVKTNAGVLTKHKAFSSKQGLVISSMAFLSGGTVVHVLRPLETLHSSKPLRWKLFGGLIKPLGKDVQIHRRGALVSGGERCAPRGPRSRCELWQLQACLQSRGGAHATLMASALGVRGPHLGNLFSGKPRTASSSRMPKTQWWHIAPSWNAG